MSSSHPNIPTDLVRTVVAIAETGSLTRAAKRLGLSQPAVTSHVKRIQEILGHSLFTKTSNGSAPTDLGRLFLDQARRMLNAHDQILQLGGLLQNPKPVRLGISAIFVADFLQNQNAQMMPHMTVQIDDCMGIAKSMIESHIDIACIIDNANLPPEILDLVVAECTEEMAWVRAPHFKLTPNKAIPILLWPCDNFMIRELSRRNLAYNIVFSSNDYHAKLNAAAAGIGMTAMPRRLIPPNLVAADEDNLPALPSARGLLCTRPYLSDFARTIADRIAARYFRRDRDTRLPTRTAS